MSRRRFEEEGLPALERGEPLADHFETDPESVEARAAYDRLKERLADRPSWTPPKGWQEDVWRAIEASSNTSSRESSDELPTSVDASADAASPAASPAADGVRDGGETEDDHVVRGPWWRRPQATRAAVWAGILAATLGWMVLRPTTVPSKVGLDLRVLAGSQTQLRGDADLVSSGEAQPGDILRLSRRPR